MVRTHAATAYGCGTLALILTAAVSSPLRADVISGESMAFGASSSVWVVGETVTLEVALAGVSQGQAPPAYNQSQSAVQLDVSADLAPGLMLGSISGTLSSSASSVVDGGAGSRQTHAGATTDEFDLSLVTLLATTFLAIDATTVDSVATVSGGCGVLNTFGDSTLENLSLVIHGEDVDLSAFVNAEGKAEPNTVLGSGVLGVDGLTIFLNEQVVSGDGMTEAGIEVNAIRIVLDDVDTGIVGVGLVNGEIVISHSEADQQADPEWECTADLNCDGIVGILDLMLLFDAWGECSDPSDCPADLNGDGVVNVGDMLILFVQWKECP